MTVRQPFLRKSVDGKNDDGKICEHCKMPIAIRNPSGFCDHLYYPDYCDVCHLAKKLTTVKG